MTFSERLLSSHHTHYVWDNSLPPAIEVGSGEIFTVATREASGGQLTPASTATRLRRLDLGGFWPLSGPVAVRGARPGDAVQVEVLETHTGSWGWTAIIPERGLLRDEIPGPYLHHWELRPGQRTARMRADIAAPLRPFLGLIGCAPAGPGTRSPLPPRPTGGKLDLPLAPGATLVLPVAVEGALLSFGHGRAAQGDGEVCGFGIECDLQALVRVTVEPGRAPAQPYALLPDPPPALPGPRRVVIASAPQPQEAVRAATRELIAWLRAERRLSREAAYALCSVAAELRVAQAVNLPNWTVAMSLPLAILE